MGFKDTVVLTFAVILLALGISSCSAGCSSSSSSSSSSSDSSYTSAYDTWDDDDGYDHIINRSRTNTFKNYGYDSPSVSEDEAFIDRIGGEWVFIH